MWLSKSIGDLMKIVWKFEVHFKQYYKTKYKLMHFQYVKSDVFFLSTKMCVHVKLSITSCWFISCPIIFSVPCIDKWTHYNIPVKYRAFSG